MTIHALRDLWDIDQGECDKEDAFSASNSPLDGLLVVKGGLDDLTPNFGERTSSGRAGVARNSARRESTVRNERASGRGALEACGAKYGSNTRHCEFVSVPNAPRGQVVLLAGLRNMAVSLVLQVEENYAARRVRAGLEQVMRFL